ncbi:MAG: recombinase family protein [Acidimicrobiales bacterium]
MVAPRGDRNCTHGPRHQRHGAQGRPRRLAGWHSAPRHRTRRRQPSRHQPTRVRPHRADLRALCHRHSRSSVAAELNDEDQRTRTGRPWSAKVVLDILRNRTYLGEVYFRGTWHRSAEEQFVDPALFDRV